MEGKKIDNEFVPVMEKEMLLVDGDTIPPFGKEELIQVTLQKCAETLNSDMLNIMIK